MNVEKLRYHYKKKFPYAKVLCVGVRCVRACVYMYHVETCNYTEQYFIKFNKKCWASIRIN